MRLLNAAAVADNQKRAGAFRPEISLRRGTLRAAEDELLSDRGTGPLIALGGPGTGKTTWLCQIAEERRRMNQAVIYLDDAADTGGSFDEREVIETLESLARSSRDRKIVVLADDAGGRPLRDVVLLRILSLARAATDARGVRILLSLRSEIFARFLDHHAARLRDYALREITLQPFDRHELALVAGQLPLQDGDDAEAVRSARGRAAAQLAATADPSSLVPALAVSFLETISTPSFLGGLSKYKLYSHLYYGHVLRATDDPVNVRKSRLLKELAVTLAAQRSDAVAVDAAPTSVGMMNVDTLYRDLTSTRVVERRIDDYGIHVGFVDEDFLAFVAAIAIDGPVADRLREYLAKGEEFPRARRVAAFFVARVISGSAGGAEQVFATLPSDDVGFLQLVGELDRDAFLALLPFLADQSATEAIRLVEEFQTAGFPHLAVDGARLLLDCVPPSELRRVQRLYGEALCKVDRLEPAQKVLSELARTTEPDSALLYLLGEIAVARHQLRDAKRWYSRMLTTPAVTVEARARALHGLGDVESWHGRNDEAATTIQEAIDLYATLGDSADLAEAWGDLSLVLVDLGRCREAREAVARSREVNLRLPMSMPGLIIVRGLEGNVALCEGNLDVAETRLSRCLDECRNYGLRWREAWCLQRLAEVAARRGVRKRAAELRARAKEILRLL